MGRLRLRDTINLHQGHRTREWPKQDLNPGIFNYENYVLSNNVIHVKLRFHTFMRVGISQVKLRKGKNITNKKTKPYKKRTMLVWHKNTKQSQDYDVSQKADKDWMWSMNPKDSRRGEQPLQIATLLMSRAFDNCRLHCALREVTMARHPFCCCQPVTLWPQSLQHRRNHTLILGISAANFKHWIPIKDSQVPFLNIYIQLFSA